MNRPKSNSRKGISAVFGAVMLFAMLFTTGSSYFLFVIASQQVLNSSHLDAQYAADEMVQERFTINASKLSTTKKIGVGITNLAPSAIKIVRIIVVNSTNPTVYELDGTPGVGRATIPNLPRYINPGSTETKIDTQITPKAGTTYTIKAMTERGNIAVTYYPDLNSAEYVAQSLLSQGVGDIQMEFESFQYAHTNTPPLTWAQAADIPKSIPAAFKIELVNHGLKDIYISQQSAISVIRAGSSSTSTFYIVSSVNDATGLALPLLSGSYIQVPANPDNVAQGGSPVTLYFTATSMGGSSSASTPTQSDIWYVLIGLKGTYTSPGSADNFSQLIPFKTVFVLP